MTFPPPPPPSFDPSLRRRSFNDDVVGPFRTRFDRGVVFVSILEERLEKLGCFQRMYRIKGLETPFKKFDLEKLDSKGCLERLYRKVIRKTGL